MKQPLLALQELSKYYVNGQNVVAGLNKVSLTFSLGEFVAITGESGSGKSSLAHILGGILPYEDGEMFLEGKPTSHFDSADWERYRAESVGFISQSYGILPGATVLENVLSALRLTGLDKIAAADEAKRILDEVELWPMRSRRAAKLSSGQKQRLSIARALAKPCSVLIADEPTGNLDPENSDKVIKLLSKAAQDRLVILITHEFSECADYVTRHIQLQDGRICADARLRPAPEVTSPPEKRSRAGDLSGYIAGVQLRSRPAWSMVVLLFTVLTAFAVFAFLGSFIVALDDTSTRIYNDEAFLNGHMERIVAVRADGAPMTQADYDAILSISHVAYLEKYGYIQDINYAWQEGTDYRINYPRENYGTFRNAVYKEYPVPELLLTDRFLQTVPLQKTDSGFLTAGRLPQQFNEVVAAGDESLLGQSFTVYIKNQTEWLLGGCLELTVTVVGVTGFGEGLYFHDDVGRTLTMDYLGSPYLYMPYYGDIPSSGTYINYREARSKIMYGEYCVPFYAELEPDKDSRMRPMEDSEVYISLYHYTQLLSETPTANYSALYRKGITTDYGKLNIAGLNTSGMETALCVSPAEFQRVLELSGVGNGNQVGVMLTDYAYTQRVLKALDKAGYFALSPYVLGSAEIDPELAAQRVQTLLICAGALLMILLLQLVVFRAMFNMEHDSYRILSDMGLTCRCAQRSIFFQLLIFTFAGQLLGLGAVGLCSLLGIDRIGQLTKYLYGPWWIAISLIHLGSTMLAGWLIAGGLKKAVYPRTPRARDLILDDEEAEV